MEAPRKEIQLPPSVDGYYRFGSLPGLIADARHRDDGGPPDHLTRVVIWRDDGTEAGQYVECLPPEGAKLKDFTRADGWTLTPMPPRKPGEPPLPHEHDRSHVNLLPKQQRSLWLDGALVVTQEWTSHEYDRAWSWNEERDRYTDLLTQAAQLSPDAPGRLQVVDGNRNEIECREGPALNDGNVHISWLNAWGATQQPVALFVGDANPTNRDEDHAPEPPRVGRARRDALTSVIERAVKESSDPISPVEVMKVLRKMAGSAERPDPLLGVDDNGDIKWGLINSDDKPKFLDTDALGKRMKRLTDRQHRLTPISAD